MDSYRPASLFAPAPPRRLTLEPADDDKQDCEKRDHREKKLKLSIGAEEQRVDADQSEVTRQHRPALPGRRRTPAPAVPFCPKAIFHDHSYSRTKPMVTNAAISFTAWASIGSEGSV